MNTDMRSKGERLFSALLFVLGLIIVTGSFQIGFGQFTKPGPGLFSFFCGLILCIQSLFSNVFKQEHREKEDVLKDPGAIGKCIFSIITLLLWIILMPLLGWLPLTFLVTLSFAKIMLLEGWIKPLVLAAANTLFSYLLFGYLLLIDLPNVFWE
jgi:hypothetical protein